MTLKKLKVAPGIRNENSDLGLEGAWKDGNRVRFYKGSPEKIGGWQKATTSEFKGLARGTKAWIDLQDKSWIGFGTHLKLYLWGTAFTDITPIRASSTIDSNPFTTNATTTVSVNDTAHGAVVNDFVTFSGATTVDSLDMNAEWQITAITDDDNYTFTHTGTASGSSSGGGASVTAAYQINTGGANGVFGLGWGAGTWGSSTWGTARSSSNIFSFARTWSLDTFGEDLIANPRGGGIYRWDASVGVDTRAAIVSNAPTTATFILTTPDSRQLIAFGAHDGVANNTLNIRWTDKEDATSWTSTATNSAGDRLLDTGSQILSAIRTEQEILVFTDESVYSMQFIGGNEVFAFHLLSEDAGQRGPHSAAVYQNKTYWMGTNNFYIHDGRVRILPCDVRSHVFDNLIDSQRDKCFAGVNREFNEIWWFYPTTAGTEIDKYVVYDIEENVWHIGDLARTAWEDRGEVWNAIHAFGATGALWNHETGVDDDTGGMSWHLEMGDMDIEDGENFAFIDKIIPDFENLTGNITYTLKTRRYPRSGQISKTYTFTTGKEFLPVRARGRQIAIRMESSDVSQTFRLDSNNANSRADGGR